MDNHGNLKSGFPQISILMAIYEPRMDWLKEQLLSLNSQTYPNIYLYIQEDCSPNVPFSEIESCIQGCITAFPYEVERNEKNLGSNGTFERLTQRAEGDYFAYCDQDDIWLPEKLEHYAQAMEDPEVQLVCSDMYIINEHGEQTASSITKLRPHHIFHAGEHLASGLLLSNFVTGCAMMCRADMAKAAVPFCPFMVHDHYLALYAAEHGKIAVTEKPWIQYRIHGSNQTLVLSGVTDKKQYQKIRILNPERRFIWLMAHFPCGKELKADLADILQWVQARKEYFSGRFGAAGLIWKLRRFSPLISIYEIVMAHAPEKLFMLAIQFLQKKESSSQRI